MCVPRCLHVSRLLFFILQLTPSDSAGRRSEQGCSPVITASVINSFIQRWRGEPAAIFVPPSNKHLVKHRRTHTHTCRRASHRPTLINVRLSVFNLFTSGLCGRQVLRSRPCVIHLKPLQRGQDSGGVIENIGADLNAGIENKKIFGVIVAQAECPLEHCQRWTAGNPAWSGWYVEEIPCTDTGVLMDDVL